MNPSTPAHQAIYRRWRAQTFSEIVGQEAVVETLRNAVRTGRVSQAILFVGPRGTGKTSLARILAKALNCTDLRGGDPCDACESCVAIREGRALDLVEIDAASNRGIEPIRELRERVNYAPTDLRRKVYILDEAHQITRDGWPALLKTLEEPPEFVTFMFASTHPQEFPPAILSRLQRYDVRKLTVAEIEGKLRRILEADGRDADPDAIGLIARLAAGGMRDAESMLDQLLSSTGDRLDAARVRDLLGLADGEAVRAFGDALATGDALAGLLILDGLEERGRDLRLFLDQLVESLREELRSVLTSGPTNGRTALQVAAAGRRLASIDPSRAGPGGLRLQLEVALFAPESATVGPPATAEATAPRTAPAASAATPAPPRPAPTAPRPVSAPEAGSSAEPNRRRGKPASPDPDATAPVAPSADATSPAPAAADPGPMTDPVEPAPAAAGLPDPRDAGDPVDPDLARLRDQWPEIVAHVSPAVRAIIGECRPLGVEGNGVTLGFPETRPFLKDHAERRRPELEAAVGRFLGRTVSVRCVATNIELVPSTPADADSALVLAEARRIFADDLVDVSEIN
ncbi:MAG TPA: DNA polymerase III subunit gamma/tau [Candidatus Limnocylindrales bacterium]